MYQTPVSKRSLLLFVLFVKALYASYDVSTYIEINMLQHLANGTKK